MKKYLVVISFVLISLIAINAVSAGDNATDDAVIASIDGSEELAVSELNDVNEKSAAGDVQSEFNCSDVLLEDRDMPAVDVNDITLNGGDNAAVPFNVTDSNGGLVSGSVNVTVKGSTDNLYRNIELNNLTGQNNFTLLDFIGLIKANDANISDIYDMLYSSSNFTNIDFSQIAAGLYEINGGYAINISDMIGATDRIINATQIDSDKIIEGITDIINATDINISEFIAGFSELIGAIDINASQIPNITGVLAAVLEGFHYDNSKLTDNILASIFIKQAQFRNGLNELMSELGYSSQGSFVDLCTRLKLDLSLKITLELGLLMYKNEVTLLELTNIAKEIWDYNKFTKESFLKRLSDATNGFTFNISKIITKLANPSATVDMGAVNKIIGSVRIDTDKFSAALNDAVNAVTFDKSKVADEVAQITGIDSSKLLKFLDGVEDIYHGFNCNPSAILLGIADINKGFASVDSGALVNIFDAVSFKKELLSADLDNILAEFNYTRSDILSGLHKSFENLNWTVPDNLDAKLSDAVYRDNFNFTEFSDAVGEIISYNGEVSLNSDALASYTSGFTFSFSNIIERLADNTADLSKTLNTLLKIIRYVEIDYNKIYSSAGAAKEVSYNKSYFISGMSKIAGAFDLNVSKITMGINKIHEIDFNESKAAELMETIRNDINVDSSIVLGSLTKIYDSLSFNKEGVYNGLAKLVTAFSFKRSSVYEGFDEIKNSVSYNSSRISGGVYKLLCGFGVNVSDFFAKFTKKYGYIATFTQVLSPGTHDIAVEYSNGDSSARDNATLTVLSKTYSPMEFDVKVDGHHVYINGQLDPDAKGLVLFEIGDMDVYNIICDGKITFEDDFQPGAYDIRAVYLGDARFNRNTTVISFIVKSQTSIASSNVNVVYGNSKNIVVCLKDENGNPIYGESISVKLNGNTYVRTTDSNGQVSIAVPSNLKPTTYTTSVTFAGDSGYVKSSASVKVVVGKATPKITASAKTFKKSVKTKKYTVVLKNNKNGVMKNTKLTIKVNGKSYTAKTDSKGKATFKITKLTKKGTFKATLTYAGNSYYNKLTKKVTIKVK